MNLKLYVSNPEGSVLYQPVIEEGIEWSTERRGTPGKLTFKVIPDSVLKMTEGNPVRLEVNGNKLFYGYIFKQQRSKDGLISITAYDQLRYLKNKDTLSYETMKASEVIQMIAADFNLQVGELEDTGYIIPYRTEDNATLYDMIETALDLTMTNKKEMYVFYDDFGKLTLKNISNMYVGSDNKYLMIDEETGENFEYTSSIDSDTYNKIKLTYENEDTGKRDVYIVKDIGNINLWGVLQYHDTLQKGENGQTKADALLTLYNKKTRNLKITNAFGDIRVRAGSMVVVKMDLGDVQVQNFMLVEKVTHKFKESEHWMDLTLRGGEFIG